jgi:nucleoside-diphosphate-sugar epimerase
MINNTPKKVTVTGAFGNIGTFTIRELLSRGYSVRAFDIKNKKNKKTAAGFADKIEIVWGDISSLFDAAKAVEGADYVVHLAFILPTLSETNPKLAESVNIGGTDNIIKAIQLQEKKAGILLASSFAVYGDTRNIKELVTLKTPVNPSNNYTRHKISIESAVKKSGLPWIIFRFGAVLTADTILNGKFDSLIFEQPPDAHQEFIHTADAALAIANALETKKAWNKIHLISGGRECMLEYRDLINRSLEAIGIGSLPDSVFSPVPLQGGAWMDTRESQDLLKYQRCTYDEHCRQIVEIIGPKRYLMRAVSPVIRWYLKRMSPFYKKG